MDEDFILAQFHTCSVHFWQSIIFNLLNTALEAHRRMEDERRQDAEENPETIYSQLRLLWPFQ